MEEKEVEIIEIKGKEFIIIDKINEYIYTSEIDNPDNIMVLKDTNDNYISLSSNEELNKAFELYHNKNN